MLGVALYVPETATVGGFRARLRRKKSMSSSAASIS
jgi:hypothetical protein